MATNKGKFIVFEGLDGSGKSTQIKLLVDKLESRGVEVENLHYPDYESGVGKLIHQFLYREYDFSPETQFLLYFSDFIKDKGKIKQWLEQGKTVVADRYFSATIAYQCLKGFPLEKALKIADLFEITKPDIIFYINVSSDVSMERKFKEKDQLDRHEGDKKLLSDLEKVFKDLIDKQIFAKWVNINGEQDINKVHQDICQILQ